MNNNNASPDLSDASRNELGHRLDCKYWDWQDFTKCDCAAGLANVTTPERLYRPGAMSMRDYFAAMIPIPWDEGLNLAAAEHSERIELGGKLTLAEISLARARLRYTEAAAMIMVREELAQRDQARAETETDQVTSKNESQAVTLD